MSIEGRVARSAPAVMLRLPDYFKVASRVEGLIGREWIEGIIDRDIAIGAAVTSVGGEGI